MESVKHASLEIFSIWLVKANLTKQPDFKFSPAIFRGLGDMTGVLSILKKNIWLYVLRAPDFH